MVLISSFSLIYKELIVQQKQSSASKTVFLVLCFIVTGTCSMLAFRKEDSLAWILLGAVGTGTVCVLVVYGFMAMIEQDAKKPLRRKRYRVR